MSWLRDAAERVAATYVAALVGFLLADVLAGNAVDVSVVQAAALAAIPAAVSAIKAILASRVGTAGTASLAD